MSNAINTHEYNLHTWTLPFWEGNTVYNESVYPMSSPDGTNLPVNLLYEASEILEVKSSDLQILYKENQDYYFEDGHLFIPKGSSIKVNTYQEYYPSEQSAFTQNKTGGGFLFFSEGSVYHQKQISITYTHKEVWSGPVPKAKGKKLPMLQKALKTKSSLNLLVFGDSIAEGANASGREEAAPFMPTWPEIFADKQSDMGAKVSYINKSVVGETSAFAARPDKINELIRLSPDLIILAWGMNDSSPWVNTSPQSYRDNLETIIKALRAVYPATEFILVGSMLPNPEAKDFFQEGRINEFNKGLYELESSYKGVVVAEITDLHTHVLKRKAYRDMTGNNINHPNDFLARLYAQVLIKTIS